MGSRDEGEDFVNPYSGDMNETVRETLSFHPMPRAGLWHHPAPAAAGEAQRMDGGALCDGRGGLGRHAAGVQQLRDF